MPIAITDEHRHLAEVASSFAERHELLLRARQSLEAPDGSLEDWWKELADLGWLGLHVPEEHGGQGYSLAETAVVAEVLARSVAPGPFLSSVVVSTVLAMSQHATAIERWMPGLLDGSVRGGVGFGALVLSGDLADVVLVARGDDMVLAGRDEVRLTPCESLDPTRRVAEIVLPDGAGTILPGTRDAALAVARALAAAEASGLAHACTDMAVAYAKVREQFGRVIGSFMAVKHHCANMKVQAE